ncbi:hypothetical protein V2J09_013790 [Rumex salicifolius]
MAKRLIPLLNRVLVEKIVPPAKTSAGILLPEKTSKLNSGKVIAVGAGLRNKEGNLIPLSVKEGDTVLLPEYGGTQVKLEEKEYLLPLPLHLHPRTGLPRQQLHPAHIMFLASHICMVSSGTVRARYCFDLREVRGANPTMKKWRRGKGIKFTASFLRSELS